jgi:diketogulonate reductase-like aldo/keto reductase
MEAIHASGRARLLGISNVSLEQLEGLCAEASVRPRFVQNRCYATTGWDRRVREFCVANDIIYQGFSLLTANPAVLAHAEVAKLAQSHGKTAEQIIFRFAIDIGMVPLTGTTDAGHMRLDLDVFNFHLEAAEVKRVEGLAEDVRR